MQEFLVEAGHEDEGISRNSEWDTPLMLAAEAKQIEVGKLLIAVFPRCVPWTNKSGMDAVSFHIRYFAFGRLHLPEHMRLFSLTRFRVVTSQHFLHFIHQTSKTKNYLLTSA